MPRDAVVKDHSPGEAGRLAEAATADEAGQASHGDRGRHGHGEAVARLDGHAQKGLGQLDSEVASDQAEQDRLAVVEPGLAALQALPVGQHKRDF